MISHDFHLLSFVVVGEAGVIGEAGISSGASATAGSLGAMDDLDTMNSPVASSIDVRPSSPGDFGDENQAPGNNREEVDDPFRPREGISMAPEGPPEMSRSNFGLNFLLIHCGQQTREYINHLSGASSRLSGTSGK